MIYWDGCDFQPGFAALIIIINLSFFVTFMSSAVAVTLFVMMCCATIFARIELVYQKHHVSKFLPHENSPLDKSKTVFRPDCL